MEPRYINMFIFGTAYALLGALVIYGGFKVPTKWSNTVGHSLKSGGGVAALIGSLGSITGLAMLFQG